MAAKKGLGVQLFIPLIGIDLNNIVYKREEVEKALEKVEGKTLPLTVRKGEERFVIGEVSKFHLDEEALICEGQVFKGGTIELAKVELVGDCTILTDIDFRGIGLELGEQCSLMPIDKDSSESCEAQNVDLDSRVD